MKRGFLISICFLLFCLFLTACGESNSSKKEKIFAYVLENGDSLRQDIEACETVEDIRRMEGVETIRKPYVTDNVVIVFECGAEGMVSSSAQYGFYYSEEDMITSSGTTWTAGVDLTEDGDGYSWSESDNYYYTEKICDQFYYYIAWN